MTGLTLLHTRRPPRLDPPPRGGGGARGGGDDTRGPAWPRPRGLSATRKSTPPHGRAPLPVLPQLQCMLYVKLIDTSVCNAWGLAEGEIYHIDVIS